MKIPNHRIPEFPYADCRVPGDPSPVAWYLIVLRNDWLKRSAEAQKNGDRFDEPYPLIMNAQELSNFYTGTRQETAPDSPRGVVAVLHNLAAQILLKIWSSLENTPIGP